ncbi:electron transport complex subunit E [Thiolapillus brandeum]|uniref:Ion-translocating oxidoreductase complex subunit E n=1 Tax=Thiolapillus brandeum TaxID=1076588 RepID=A0A7U6GJR9_9GAMM|nr:electron transport complex subunit E [Thiolapillus brandeum]BAO44877.1 electron transport complex protein RnfE [Thiolapillus brandeum]
MSISNREIITNGLWNNNQALVALLGLCPLLAVSNTLINGMGLGLATTLVLISSNATISFIRNWVRQEVRLPVFVLVIASFVTAVELAMNAWFHDLHKILGIFIPLIVTNCTIVGRAEAFASRNPVPQSMLDGLSIGMGFTLVLMTLGALREFIGQGTILSGVHLMFGEAARSLSFSMGNDFHGLILAILPPGAFFGLGLLIALKHVIDKRNAKRAAEHLPAPAAEPAPAEG